MFKSIFTKYITAFMVITLISFTLLAVIMSSMITNYSFEAKRQLIDATSLSTMQSLRSFMQLTETDISELLSDNSDEIRQTLVIQAKNAEALVFITDPAGKVLVSSLEENDPTLSTTISPQVAQHIVSGQEHYSFSDLDGTFDKKHLNSVHLLYDNSEGETVDLNEPIGILFICAPSAQITGFVDQMSRTVMISTLLVFIVALVAVYLISEKITDPLKEMSRAAKAFAQGHFDVRVPVRGEDEVGELAKAFNSMAASLEKTEEMRSTFLANISHDLRTPMTSISGIIDCILDGAIPPEKHSHYLQQIASEVRRLSRLVSSLLDISRMQAGDRKFKKSAFDICELSRQILISFEKRLEEKKLDVVFDTENDNIAVFADTDAIHQVMFNLIDNAVKFSNPGGQLTICITTKDKKVSVSVTNTGEGIPQEDLPYVFDRFYKTDRSRGLDKTGVGLGLFIVRTIIERHGEEIRVESEYQKNCRFTFTLAAAHTGKGNKKQ